MALTHLADTSVLTNLHRPTIADAFQSFADAGVLGRPTVVDLEIGAQGRNAAEWDAYHAAVAALTHVPMAQADLDRALAVQRQLAGRSQLGRKLPDLLIAAVAEQAGLTVLHYDHDFDLIAEVTGQPCQWIVPAGSAET